MLEVENLNEYLPAVQKYFDKWDLGISEYIIVSIIAGLIFFFMIGGESYGFKG